MARGPFQAHLRPDSQPAFVSLRTRSRGPNIDSDGYNTLQRRPDPALRPEKPEVHPFTPLTGNHISRRRRFRAQFGWDHTVHPWKARIAAILHDENGRRISSRGQRG